MEHRPETRPGQAEFRHRVQAAFERALEVPPDVRGPWLETECEGDLRLRAEVAGLLSLLDQSKQFLGQEQVEQSVRAIESFDPGETVGPYEVVRELGRGGMGIVLLARRADGQFEQQVALKLLKRGVNSEAVLAGFLRERQILAWLKHPNIARLYDGGLTSEGHPWFALEYVQGRAITEYCASRKLAARERVELMITACEAVQHAHRNLVIHRDLKPSNILVTDDGELKLLDFGIAAVLRESELAFPAAPEPKAWTPDYAAPEQLRNEPVTTAADIYALGALLHELLTGTLPDRGDSPDPVVRGGGDSPRAVPSHATGDGGTRRLLRGDLDRILLKATHPEPEARYTTAEAFAGDLRRFLDGRPVNARRQTLPYRASRFVRRHRWRVLGAAVIVTVILGASLVASNQRAEARRERARVGSVKDFLVNLVRSANPNAEGGAALRDEAILAVALERAKTDLSGEPDMQAELYDVVGKAYVARGDLAGAVDPLTRSLQLRRMVHGGRDSSVADAAYAMAALLRREKRYEEAERYYREALDIRSDLDGKRSLEVSVLLNGLGANAYGAGDLEQAERYYRESLALKEELLDEGHEELAAGRHNLALLLRKRGNYEEAERLERLALRTNQRVYGDAHPVTATSHGGLGRIFHETGRHAEAAREFRRAYEIRLAALGSDHPHTRLALDNLARSLYDAADFRGSEEQYRSLLSATEQALGKASPAYVRTLCDLGDVLVERGKLDEAGATYAEAGTLGGSLGSGGDEFTARVLAGQGAVALARGRLEEALSRLNQAHRFYADGRSGTREALGVQVRRGDCLSRMGRYGEAKDMLLPAYRRSREKLEYTWEARLARNRLREHLIRTGRKDEAEKLN